MSENLTQKRATIFYRDTWSPHLKYLLLLIFYGNISTIHFCDKKFASHFKVSFVSKSLAFMQMAPWSPYAGSFGYHPSTTVVCIVVGRGVEKKRNQSKHQWRNLPATTSVYQYTFVLAYMLHLKSRKTSPILNSGKVLILHLLFWGCLRYSAWRRHIKHLIGRSRLLSPSLYHTSGLLWSTKDVQCLPINRCGLSLRA